MRRSPYIAYRLVLKDVRSEYTKSALGIFWDFADPLVLGVVFYTLRRSAVIDPGDLSMPYSIFIIYGLLMYLTFSDSVILSANMMVRSRGILTYVRIPPEAMIQSVFFRVLFNSVFRILVMLAFSVVLHSSSSAQGMSTFSPLGFVKFLALFPVLILVGMGIGTILAPFQVIYNDVSRIVRIILVPLRFISPVIWAIPSTGIFVYVNALNPITPILDDLRSLATAGTMNYGPEIAIRFGVFGLLFLFGWFLFHITVPILAEKT